MHHIFLSFITNLECHLTLDFMFGKPWNIREHKLKRINMVMTLYAALVVSWFMMNRLFIAVVTLTLCLSIVNSGPPATTPKPGEDDDDTYFKAALYLGECKVEMKLNSYADIEALFKPTPLNKNSKCLIKCVGEKFDLLKGGKIVEKEVLEWIDEDRQLNATLGQLEQQMYNTCKGVTGTDECDFAGKLFVCIKEFAIKNRLDFD